MNRKALSGVMLTLLLIGISALAFDFQPVRAESAIIVPDNYEKIQWAIGNSSSGDTIFVRAGTYYEHLAINKHNLTLLGEDKETTIIDGGGTETVVQITAKDAKINGFTIRNGGPTYFGISICYSSNDELTDNNITNNYGGIYLFHSSNNTLSGNIVRNNYDGISLYYAFNNFLSGNSIADNFSYGIHLSRSSDNFLSCNTVTGNSWYGVYLGNSSNNILLDNIVADNGEDGILIEQGSNNNSLSSNTIANNEYGITLEHSSSNNSIYGNNVTNNKWWGINLYESSNNNSILRNNVTYNEEDGISLDMSSNNNSIHRNNVVSNRHGIRLWYSPNNNISENNVTSNEYGIYIRQSSNNIFYHNSFVDNLRQVCMYAPDPSEIPPTNAWDDGYPSGGNYWSDYEERYPDATEIDDSGIWDTPYVIDESNQDNYPLMEPWTPTPPIPTTINELKTEIKEMGLEGEIDNQGIVRSLLAKLNVAQKLVDKGKIDEAKSILEEDFIPQVQNLTDIHITKDTAELLIQSAEYIISNL